MASSFSRFLAELKRRKVTRVAVVYVLVGLGIIEAVDIIGDRLLFPAWAIQFVIVLVLIGLPIALVLAWALEVTPEGIQRTPDVTPDELAAHTPARWKASNWVMAGMGLVLIGAGVYFVFFRGEGQRVGTAADGPAQSEAVATEEIDWVAVLPPENQTGDPSLDILASAAADWISDGLSRTDLGQVVPFNEVMAASNALAAEGSAPSALQATWPQETGGTMAVTGSYYPAGDSIEFRLRVVDREGTVLGSVDPVKVAADNPSPGLNALQLRVLYAVASIVSPGHDLVFTLEGKHPPSLEAHQAQ